jgi:hypothetical protein|tara:strand:- start:742 stop:957 length:216 start_codon:yes stop_codon:yes gene_type:complete
MKTIHFYIIILQKVSFNSVLFFKEYRKAYKKLGVSDRIKLKKWMLKKINSTPNLCLNYKEIYNHELIGAII